MSNFPPFSLDFQKDILFCKVCPMVVNVEGGYSDDPKDPGGPTFRGIAWNYNVPILQSMGINDVRELTLNQTMFIYYQEYWVRSNANLVPEVGLAYIHFDAAVNCGVSEAILFLNRLSKHPADYEAGGKNKFLWMSLIFEYMAERMNFYTHSKGRETYLEGWINRLVQVSHNALTMETT